MRCDSRGIESWLLVEITALQRPTCAALLNTAFGSCPPPHTQHAAASDTEQLPATAVLQLVLLEIDTSLQSLKKRAARFPATFKLYPINARQMLHLRANSTQNVVQEAPLLLRLSHAALMPQT